MVSKPPIDCGALHKSLRRMSLRRRNLTHQANRLSVVHPQRGAPMTKQPGRIYASDLARELGMNEKVARAKLRAAGYEAPYKEKACKKL